MQALWVLPVLLEARETHNCAPVQEEAAFLAEAGDIIAAEELAHCAAALDSAATIDAEADRDKAWTADLEEKLDATLVEAKRVMHFIDTKVRAATGAESFNQ